MPLKIKKSNLKSALMPALPFIMALFLWPLGLIVKDVLPAVNAAEATPSPEDLDDMMKKLLDPAIPEIDKQRIAGVVFYHNDVYRKAVMLDKFPADSPQVQAFLKYKKDMQEEVIRRMGVQYKNKFGDAPKTPIIPFDYNNIFSDDDIVTGTGEAGRRLEGVYNDALSEVVKERVGRPMSDLDRRRIDVNGLAWNMTQDAAHMDFSHREKYINPQSAYANQRKLIDAAQKGGVTAYTYDNDGRMIKLSPEETVKEIKRLNVDAPLSIPGIDPSAGSGSMSDFLRMAQMHQIKPSGKVTVEEIQQFIRNQKYSQRVIGDYDEIFKADAALSKEYKDFVELSNKLRDATSVRQVAEILDAGYGAKILSAAGEVDYEKLTAALLGHQQKQLNEVLPKMIGHVTKTEAYKIIEWLKTAGAADRNRLRKEMALTYAPMNDHAIQQIVSDLDKMPVDEADKAFLKSVVEKDSRQIRRYAELLEIEPGELARRLNIDGDNLAIVDFISKTAKVKPFNDALAGARGGSQFQEFLKSKTAKALNLDTMLSSDAQGSEKFMQWSMLILAASRAYNAAGSNEEGLKAMGMAMFEMVPFVSATLRFSEMEWKESFKELAMDILPPLALANIAVQILHYTAEAAKSVFTEAVWEKKAGEVLDMMTDDDFVESDLKGYWRLKNRGELLEFLDDVEPGLGHIAKLASLVEPEIEARMGRHPDVQTNNAAIYTLQWFEEFNAAGLTLKYKQMFDLEQLKAKVYEKGVPAADAASPVERVAAKILMDNLRIRKQIYYEVLSDFADRIERMYNDTKKDEEEEYGAIVGKAIAALKAIYENAPEKIKKSEWGMEKLEKEYYKHLEFMTNYKPDPEDKPDIEIQREMQKILDEFREFIRKLAIAVDIQEEMQYLDLQGGLYGGEKSMEPVNTLLLGDTFRVGISARVHAMRQKLPWTVYYYAYNAEKGQLEVLGKVSVNAGPFNPGNDGLWVIQAPSKETFYQVTKAQVKSLFAQEQSYVILPVLAFGNWPSDPISVVGSAALQYPLDHPELFDEDRAAFLGAEINFTVSRGKIYVQAPSWIYRNDKPELKIALRIPDYASADRNHSVEAEAFAYDVQTPLPALNPDKHDPAVVDNSDPLPKKFSVSAIDFADDAKAGTFQLTVKAKLRNIDEEFQPFKQGVVVNYVDEDNPEGKEEKPADESAGQSLTDLERAMEAIEARTAVLNEQADMLADQLKGGSKAFSSSVKELSGQADTLMDQAGPVLSHPALSTLDADLAGSSRIIDANGKRLVELRGEIEKRTLDTCEVYEKIKTAEKISELEKFMEEMRTHKSGVDTLFTEYQNLKSRLDEEKRRLEAAQETLADLRAQRDAWLRGAQSAADSFTALETQFTGMQALIDQVADHQTEITDARSKADGIADEADKHKDDKDLSKEDKRSIKNIAGLHKRILKHDSSVVKTAARVNEALNLPQTELDNLRAKLVELKNNVQKMSTLISDEKMNGYEEKIKDALASYEAAMLFSDPVEEANKNAGICLSGGEDQFGNKTTPDARVAQADCSKYPGTKAEWDPADKIVRCNCPKDQVWVGDWNKCYDKRKYAVESIDCSAYAHAEPRWSDADQKALCYCSTDYEWNAAGTACRLRSDLQVAQADCSDWTGTHAEWDSEKEKPMCYCPHGQTLDKNSRQCVSVRDHELAQANCDGYGPYAYKYWDDLAREVKCGCQNGYVWNTDGTACVAQTADGSSGNELMDNLTKVFEAIEGVENGGYDSGPAVGTSGDTGSTAVAGEFSGQCQGTVTSSASSGYAGDPVTFYVTIYPPESAYVSRVTTNNPLCSNCDAVKVGEGSYQWDTKFQGSGSWTLQFIAYDQNGQTMCSGSTGGMNSLGSR